MPNLLKRCVTCKELRDQEKEFHFNGIEYKDGIKKKRTDCVYCCRKRRSKYFQTPEKRQAIKERIRRNYNNDGGIRRAKNRRYSLWNLYGLTVEEYEAKLVEQKYCCDICGIHESKASKSRLYVDHDHKTGQNRGLLCSRCNLMLGYFDHDLSRIERALEFLDKSKKPGIKSLGDNSSGWSKPKATPAPSSTKHRAR